MDIAKVLIVDDDAFIRRVGQLGLTRVANWDVTVASSGAQAVSMISQLKPDVVLLDVMMPGMDGPTTLLKIREVVGCDLPVIFMTAKVQQHEVQDYLNTNAAGVISKPFDPMVLPQEIMAIVSDWERKQCKTA